MRETVYERAQKNGGYAVGPRHPINRAKTKPGKVVMAKNESLDQKRRLVERAISRKLRPASKGKNYENGPVNSVYVRDISDDVALFDCPKTGLETGIEYNITDKGRVELGEPFTVQQQWARL